jgi:pimeloyl-ACP methyl ester carboxylesterase
MHLADGRDLAWIEVGDPTGTPVLAFHGSPGRATEFVMHHSAALSCAVRLIAVDRPGYGHSTHHPSRGLIDWADDIAQLGDHLSLDKFAVIGHSAGGPHALACAYFLRHRLLGCGVLSGPAPQARSPITEGTVLSNRIETAIYRRWPRDLDWLAVALWLLALPILEPVFQHGTRHPERGFDRMMLRMLPACDLAVVSRPEVRTVLLAEASAFNSAALRASVQDMAIGIREWGFDVREIMMPIHIWHGDLDRNISAAHAHRLTCTVPEATLHLCPGEGHWMLVDHMPEVLSVVTSERS